MAGYRIPSGKRTISYLLFLSVLWNVFTTVTAQEEPEDFHMTHILEMAPSPLPGSQLPPGMQGDMGSPGSSQGGAQQSAPEQMMLALTTSDSHVSLNLTRNTHIDSSSPVILGKGGKFETWNNTNDLDFVAYTDVNMQAAVTVEPKKMQDGSMKKQYTGSFRIRDEEYIFQPATPQQVRRKRRDVQDPVSDNDMYIVYPRNMTGADFRYDTAVRNNASSSMRLEKEMVGFLALDASPYGQQQQYGVEVLIALDYGVFERYWDASDIYGSRERENDVVQRIRHYYTHVINGMDLRFMSIDETDFRIYVRLAGFYIATSRSDSPWTEYRREYESGIPRAYVEAYDTLDDFEDWINKPEVMKKLPEFDQATLFTGYTLFSRRSDGTRRTLAGLADVWGVCAYKRASVNNDHGLYAAIQTGAHELAHSLGSLHDGTDNSCLSRDQYIMAVSPGQLNENNFNNPFSFSSCSIRYFRDHMRYLDMRDANCLRDTAAHLHPDEIERRLQKPVGQMFTLDQQCEYILGIGSFYCGGHTNDGRICEVIECYQPDTQRCYTYVEQRAADGTTCGDRMWCMDGQCVFNDRAPTAKTYCRTGNYLGRFYDGKTCPEVVYQTPWKCYNVMYTHACCDSCAAIEDEENPECLYGDKESWCLNIEKRDCYVERMSSVCCATCAKYRDDSRPDCLFGDKSSWCPDLRIRTSGCYADEKLCCKTCPEIRNLYNPVDCQYGDHASWCNRLTDKQCYQSESICCETCGRRNTGIPGCEYGDHLGECTSKDCEDPYYVNKCCSTCAHKFTTRKTTTTTTTTSTTTTTTTTTPPPPTTTTSATVFTHTAGTVPNKVSLPSLSSTSTPDGSTILPPTESLLPNASLATPGPNDTYACDDSASWCARLFPGRCYKMADKETCCNHCAQHETGIEGCQYGDMYSWCEDLHPGQCYDSSIQTSCCNFCPQHLTDVEGCEYGDYYFCGDMTPEDCEAGDTRLICCDHCARVTTPTTTTMTTPTTTTPTTATSLTPTTPTVMTTPSTTTTTTEDYNPDCIFGDHFSWCEEIVAEVDCNEEYYATYCCKKCLEAKTTTTTTTTTRPVTQTTTMATTTTTIPYECSGPDLNTWCSSMTVSHCYDDHENLCCETCGKFYTGIPGCKFGDRYSTCNEILPLDCYFKTYRDSCCIACAKFYTDILDCEYGDKSSHCSPDKCDNDYYKELCCSTCAYMDGTHNSTTTKSTLPSTTPTTSVIKPTPTPSTTSTQPEIDLSWKECFTGDAAAWCSTIKAHDCYFDDNICCDKCFTYYTGHAGCEYGDEVSWCEDAVQTSEDCSRDDIEPWCCWTCAPHNIDSHEDPQQKGEGTLLGLDSSNMREVLDKEAMLLKELNLLVNTYCSHNLERCCEMVSRQNGSNSADALLGMLTPKDFAIAKGYPKKIGNEEGIITKVLVKVDMAVINHLCEYPDRHKRDVQSSGSVYFDKSLLHRLILDNKHSLEDKIGLKILHVKFPGDYDYTNSGYIISVTIAAVAVAALIILVIGIFVARAVLRKKHKSPSSSDKQGGGSDVHQPYYMTTWKKGHNIPDWLGMCNTLNSISSGHSLVSSVYETNLDNNQIDQTSLDQGSYLEPSSSGLIPPSPHPHQPHLHHQYVEPQAVKHSILSDKGQKHPMGYQNLAYNNHDTY